MKHLIYSGLLCGVWLGLYFTVQAQSHTATASHYEQAFTLVSNMIDGKTPYDFTEAVFATEQAYFEGELDEQSFTGYLDMLASLSLHIAAQWELEEKTNTTEEHKLRAAVFTVLTDSISLVLDDSTLMVHLPFQYDFEDPFGEEDWERMFVSKLLVSKSGNCHSLPYLYKMITERLGLETHLALAPSHIYIKEFNDKNGWYNTELTSGTFPVDAWLMASGYISTDAIRNGIYLKPLTEKQSLALVLTDLVLGYKKKHGIAEPEFIMRVLDKSLEAYPGFVTAMLIQAELFTESARTETANQLRDEYLEKANKLYARIHQSGYRQVPKAMYLQWITSLQTEKEKYGNKNINY